MIKTLFRSIADMVFPRVCVVCACELGLNEELICLNCLLDLPQTQYSILERNPMSDKLNALLSSSYSDIYYPYSFATALFYYQIKTKGLKDFGNISKDLKYRRNFAVGRYFARILAEQIRKSPLYQDIDLVVPVPLYFIRRLHRGYNQADIIANEIAKVLAQDYAPNLLIRRRKTKQQTQLNVEQKKRNVQGAFVLNPSMKKMLTNAHHILIVDDVFTTGATLSQCVIAIRKETLCNSKTRISVATLGYVGQVI